MTLGIPRFLGKAAIVVAVVGCQHANNDGVRDTDEEAPAQTAGSVTISKDKQAAIGLKAPPVLRRKVRESILATGWLSAPPSSESVVKAPVTGFITPAKGDSIALGKTVAVNQRLASLQMFISPVEQSQLVAAKEEADILIRQSEASLQLAQEQLERLEENAASAVPGTRLLELREVIARSQAAKKEAQEKLPFLPEEPYKDEIRLKAIPVNASLSGRLVNIHFAPRQLVVQGDPLWTIADWSQLWVRVPVYASDVSRILRDEPAGVVVRGGKEGRQAKSLDIPQATDPGKQTVELLYEFANAAGELRPGQAVSVSLPTGKWASEVVIARSSVIWDGMGNSWVYVRTSPSTFRRRKVELGQLHGAEFVVRRGLNEGDQVVTVGAQALHSQEFKWQIQVEDDD